MPRNKSARDSGGEAAPTSPTQAILRHLDKGNMATADEKEPEATEFISTQNLLLDLSLNMPGIPVGRITVVRGWESSGKTTLVTHLVAEVQRLGGIAVLLDSEFAFDSLRAETIGVNTKELLLDQPETIEDCIDEIEKTVEAIREEYPDKLVIIIWDSVAATAPAAEIEGDFGEGKAIGAHAKLISRALRRIRGTIAEQRIALVIVNQNREDVSIGPFGGSSAGSRMIAEKPLGFHASLIIDMAKSTELRKDKANKDSPSYGIMARTKVLKNKCSNPFGRALIMCTFDHGFDQTHALFQVAMKIGMIEKSGAWYKMPGYEGSFHEAEFDDVLGEVDGLEEKIRTESYKELWASNVQKRFPDLTGGGEPVPIATAIPVEVEA